jgi:hypothetical protein
METNTISKNGISTKGKISKGNNLRLSKKTKHVFHFIGIMIVVMFVLSACNKEDKTRCDVAGTGTLLLTNKTDIDIHFKIGKTIMTLSAHDNRTIDVKSGNYNLEANNGNATLYWNLPVFISECEQSQVDFTEENSRPLTLDIFM